jgi:hypothetical protein
MENSSDPTYNRTRDPPACNAVSQATASPRTLIKLSYPYLSYTTIKTTLATLFTPIVAFSTN